MYVMFLSSRDYIYIFGLCVLIVLMISLLLLNFEQELASLRLNVDKHRATNESLKKMKVFIPHL